ncbi:uncharacterized protein [Diadema antillarum]|uniref:uncharacterized protein n=1 Tax=Diadema antillarum TaxID=105358 RepID=UPI003A8C1178
MTDDTPFQSTGTTVPLVTDGKTEYPHHTTDEPKVPDMKTEYAYQTKPDVPKVPDMNTMSTEDDTWWSPWTACSRSCGTGTRFRYAVCKPETKISDCKNGRSIALQHQTCGQYNSCQEYLIY